MFCSDQNSTKLCTKGAIQNLFNILHFLQEDMNIIWEFIIDHGLMLLLSIAKWCDLLNSQSPVYAGEEQTPPDLLNLLPGGTDSDPNIWLTHHWSIPTFTRRNADRRSFGSKRFF